MRGERPLAVDPWAPSCHTGLPMEGSWPGPTSRALAERFARLALGIDRDANAEALERLRPEARPTWSAASSAWRSGTTRSMTLRR
ncbi:MAG: hypothetical protein ACQEXJ_22365 [Myxococcota bacterium]